MQEGGRAARKRKLRTDERLPLLLRGVAVKARRGEGRNVNAVAVFVVGGQLGVTLTAIGAALEDATMNGFEVPVTGARLAKFPAEIVAIDAALRWRRRLPRWL